MENWHEELISHFRLTEGSIEDFKPAEEIEHLQSINTELLDSLRPAIQALKNVRAAGETAYLPIIKQGERAILLAEGRDEK